MDTRTTQTQKTVSGELREIRDRLNFEMKDMDKEQMKAYLQNAETLHPASVWRIMDEIPQ
jgi:hypothetical protein